MPAWIDEARPRSGARLITRSSPRQAMARSMSDAPYPRTTAVVAGSEGTHGLEDVAQQGPPFEVGEQLAAGPRREPASRPRREDENRDPEAACHTWTLAHGRAEADVKPR